MDGTNITMRAAAAVFFGAMLAACGGGSILTPSAPLPTNAGLHARGIITHVIVISMENRTYDDLFGGFAGGPANAPTPYPGGNGTISTGIALRPSGFDSDAPANAHDWFQCLNVNGFSTATWQALGAGSWPTTCPTAPPPQNPDAGHTSDGSALTIVDSAHRAAYTSIAQEFEIADNYFAVENADSFAGHQFIVALQSRNDLNETIAGTPQVPGTPLPDCGTIVPPGGVQTPVLDTVTGFTNWQYEGVTGECWHGTTFADELQNAPNMSWRHYSTDAGTVFNGFINFAQWFPLITPNDSTSHFRIGIDYLKTDLQSATAGTDFPKFTWVKPPCVALSDHPGTSHDPYGGSDWVASIINWVGGNTALWPNTVIFVVWDDWGGFYDHVAPSQPLGPFGITPGVRQPFLVISAYDRAPGGVMHHLADYASVLRFAEDLYSIPALNDLDTGAYTLDEYFDFSKPPSKFSPIPYAEPNFDPHAACGSYVGIQPYDIDR